MLLSWLAGKLLNWVFVDLRAGSNKRAMLLDAKDVVLRFPGENSFAGVFNGKEAHRKWEQRFCDLGMQIHADEVVATGPPWKVTMCVRGTDYCLSPEGEKVYDNRYVIWGHSRWGRLTDLEVYEDTQETARFQTWLDDNEPRLLATNRAKLAAH